MPPRPGRWVGPLLPQLRSLKGLHGAAHTMGPAGRASTPHTRQDCLLNFFQFHHWRET
jgi:hypothetical protein